MDGWNARLFSLVVLAAAAPSWAQDYPVKPVRMVVPFSPGAGTDLIARVVAQRLTDTLGQQFIVENRASGAAGTVGSAFVAKSPADGYTLLMANMSSHNVSPHLYKKMPYDAIRDFAPVHLGARTPQVLVIHPSLPVRDLKGFIALARSRPGQISFSSSGTGSSLHLAGELLKSLAKIDMLHVPYKGASIAMTDLIAGQVPVSFPSISTALPFIRQGTAIPLGVTARTRFSLLADVPTIEEAGVPGYEQINWIGLVAPAQTPRDIVAKLNESIAGWARDAGNQKKMAAMGFEIEAGTPAQFGEMLAKGYAATGKLMAAIGMKQE
jgi:tripartite-type tricarboxylate transporter receptor subunit TctC